MGSGCIERARQFKRALGTAAGCTMVVDLPVVLRAEAKSAGAKRYFTGKPCCRGHIVERLTVDGACLECHRIKMVRYYPGGTPAPQIKWRAANPEKVKAGRRAHYAANKEKSNRCSREWAGANADRIRELMNLRYARNPIPARVASSKRRAMKRASDGSYTEDDVRGLIKTQKGKCAHAWCRVKIDRRFHVDHIIPLSKGGSNERKNIQILCQPCNSRKYNTHPIEWAQRNGMLL